MYRPIFFSSSTTATWSTLSRKPSPSSSEPCSPTRLYAIAISNISSRVTLPRRHQITMKTTRLVDHTLSHPVLRLAQLSSRSLRRSQKHALQARLRRLSRLRLLRAVVDNDLVARASLAPSRSCPHHLFRPNSSPSLSLHRESHHHRHHPRLRLVPSPSRLLKRRIRASTMASTSRMKLGDFRRKGRQPERKLHLCRLHHRHHRRHRPHQRQSPQVKCQQPHQSRP